MEGPPLLNEGQGHSTINAYVTSIWFPKKWFFPCFDAGLSSQTSLPSYDLIVTDDAESTVCSE